MQTITIIEPGRVENVEVTAPAVAANEVLLKIKRVGFCGSDLSTYLGRNPMVSYPRIPGHEVAAVIAETGREVPTTFSVGQLATVIPYTACGKCSACRRGRANACRDNRTLGVQRDGAMCEYIAVPYDKVLPVDKLTENECALIEPLTVGTHAVNRAEVSDKDRVMVMGCGMIGAGAIAAATRRGAEVIAVDIDDTKLAIAAKIGASHTINSVKNDLHTALQKFTGGSGPDVVVEAVGNPATYRAAVAEVAFTGRIVCIGYAGSEISFATKLWVQKELDIRGSRNAEPHDFSTVIELLKTGAFPSQEVVSRVISPPEAATAFADWAAAPGDILKMIVSF